MAEISTIDQIKKFFEGIDYSVNDFLDFFDYEKIEYRKVAVDLGSTVFLADVPCGNSCYSLLIERIGNEFNLQIHRNGTEDYNEGEFDDVVVSSKSFIGRKCAILLTMAQCRYCNYELYTDIENKKKNICYM